MFVKIGLFILPLLTMFLIGLGLWWIGRWLRSKGYGNRLDKIDAIVSSAQRKANRPLSGAMVGIIRGVSRVPLFGNRKNSNILDHIDDLSKQEKRKRQD